MVLLSRLIFNLRLENERAVIGGLSAISTRTLIAPRFLGNLTAELRMDVVEEEDVVVDDDDTHTTVLSSW